MKRKIKTVQLGIGRHVSEWPVSECRDAAFWATIADWNQCRSPFIGAVYVVTIFHPESAGKPSYRFMLENGKHHLIGKYTSAAERLALLSGKEVIEDGKQKQKKTKRAG